MNESTLVPREKMSDLDWLARNVHNWPAGHQGWCYVISNRDGTKGVATSLIGQVDCPWVHIEKQEWLARRAELQNKPSWKDWPQWDFMAQNKNGCWIVSNRELIAGEDGRWHGYGAVTSRGTGEVLGDWRDTFEKRPTNLSEQAVTSRLKEATDNVLAAAPELMTDKYKFEPFVSIEDNQEKDMKQDNGWFERGDLPPVGIAVQLWHGGTYAYDCELIAKRGNDFVLWNLTWDRPDSADCMMCVFKPTPTERDVLIEIIKQWDGLVQTDDVLADAILAAGFSLGEVKNKINLFVD